MKEFKYESCGGFGTGHNPVLPGWQFDIGTDQNGKNWMCKVTPANTMTHLMWKVDFDTTEEYMVKGYDVDPGTSAWSTPFARTEVLYAKDYKDYCKATLIYYNRQIVEYKDIYKTACNFMDAHGIK